MTSSDGELLDLLDKRSSDPYYKLPRLHGAAEKINHGIHRIHGNFGSTV
jgi:hypothetical protein